MRILFIRHGDPNYKDDCLTPLGRLQAKAAAERVKHEDINRIYASTCGRAYETATYAAELLRLPIEKLDFMRELSWCWDDAVFAKGQPWRCAEDILRREGAEALRRDVWREHAYFRPEPLISCVDAAVEGFDGILAQHGYARCGDVYRCVRPNNETIAVYSHGGSSSAVIAHLLNISFPQFCTICQPERTSITAIAMHTDSEGLSIPLVEIMNDYRHILRFSEERGGTVCVSYS